MIKPLRKRHLQTWSLLALLLPAGILASVLVRPRPAAGYLLQPANEEILPVVIREIKKEDYCVRLRGHTMNTPQQLEWINTTVLRHPTALIYQTEPGNIEISNAKLIGRIEARGSYRFRLTADSKRNYHFILYDFIKEELIDSVDLSLTLKDGHP